MADIFREIDEELRQERVAQLWKRYGTYVIAGAIVVVLAVAGFVAWRGYETSQRESSSAAYSAALNTLEAGDPAVAAEEFRAIAESGSGGYSMLARLQQAEALRRAGDIEGAIAAYEAAANDGGADPVFRDLAVILRGAATLDSADPEALRRSLEPLAAEDNAWRHSARELLALLALREGQVESARDRLTQLADDPEAPANVRARAAELLAGLGS